MAFIRVGFFENFKSADTILIDVDRDGLHVLIAWLQEAISSSSKTTISDCPGAAVQAGLHVELLRTRDDAGIVRTAEGTFVWQRSEDGWTETVELLTAMKAVAGHQYLEGPQDNVQVMASIGEYGEAWWSMINSSSQ